MGAEVLEIIIACVLKLGGWKNRQMHIEYNTAQVLWLRDQVARHVKVPHRFVCFSDAEIEGVEVIPLTDDLPGWWSKIELFKRDLGRVFYLDLDTVIVGDITPMVLHGHKFSVLRNLSSKTAGRIGSGVMAWSGDQTHIYTEFMRDSQRHMAECVVSEKWGDQGFIQSVQRSTGRGWKFLQDLFPAQIVSYKFDLQRRDPEPQNTIVCFHGEPKPWETNHKWVPKLEH